MSYEICSFSITATHFLNVFACNFTEPICFVDAGNCRITIARIAFNALDVWRPSLFIFAAPHLHRLRVILDLPIFRVEMQLAICLPGNV